MLEEGAMPVKYNDRTMRSVIWLVDLPNSKRPKSWHLRPAAGYDIQINDVQRSTFTFNIRSGHAWGVGQHILLIRGCYSQLYPTGSKIPSRMSTP